MSVEERAARTGSKKMLALDGGGIRGVISLEVLQRIEDMLRAELGRDPDFVLSDYFDYIAGTSTGAIIAAGLSLGWPVARLRTLYATKGQEMFDKAFLLNRFRFKYDIARLTAMLQREFGAETTLGSDQIRTLLLLVLRNATTDSPWPLANNPHARFNDPALTDNNLNLPLWQLVRASTAAPVFFPPEVVTVGSREFIFVDGGLTMYNNPAFQLFLMSTLDAYRLGWHTGEDRLLLVSVGTGAAANANADLLPGDMNLLYNASSIPAALMYAASNEQDLLCRVFGRCRHGSGLDLEVGDISSGPGLLDPRLFSYVRYNADLSRSGLDAMGLAAVEAAAAQRMDSIEHITDLQRIGGRLAEEVEPGHFAGFLAGK